MNHLEFAIKSTPPPGDSRHDTVNLFDHDFQEYDLSYYMAGTSGGAAATSVTLQVDTGDNRWFRSVAIYYPAANRQNENIDVYWEMVAGDQANHLITARSKTSRLKFNNGSNKTLVYLRIGEAMTTSCGRTTSYRRPTSKAAT